MAENQLGILMPHTRLPIESIERVLHLPRATNRKTAENTIPGIAFRGGGKCDKQYPCG